MLAVDDEVRAEEYVEEGVGENVVVGDVLSKCVVAVLSTDVDVVILVLVCSIVVIEAVIVDGLALEEEEVSNGDVSLVLSTDVDVVILKLLVTSTVMETISLMDGVLLSSMNDGVIIIASSDNVDDME